MNKIIIVMGLVFILGWFTHYAYSISFTENPSVFVSKELISPYDRIKEWNIDIFDDRIVIRIDGATWARYSDTNSMDPILDYGANGLEIIPNSPDNIYVGDIITFRPTWSNSLIVHRVIMIDEDDQGWYCVTKGDNSTFTDPGKLRFDQIEYVLIGILY